MHGHTQTPLEPDKARGQGACSKPRRPGPIPDRTFEWRGSAGDLHPFRRAHVGGQGLADVVGIRRRKGQHLAPLRQHLHNQAGPTTTTLLGKEPVSMREDGAG